VRAPRLAFTLASGLVGGLAAPAVLLAPQPPVAERYTGVITASRNHKSGARFVFANMRSQRPFVTFQSGHAAETIKAFEDNDTIVLFFVAPVSGSTETFHLHKKLRRFTLVEVGAMEAVATRKDFRPDVSYGDLH